MQPWIPEVRVAVEAGLEMGNEEADRSELEPSADALADGPEPEDAGLGEDPRALLAGDVGSA